LECAHGRNLLGITMADAPPPRALLTSCSTRRTEQAKNLEIKIVSKALDAILTLPFVAKAGGETVLIAFE